MVEDENISCLQRMVVSLMIPACGALEGILIAPTAVRHLSEDLKSDYPFGIKILYALGVTSGIASNISSAISGDYYLLAFTNGLSAMYEISKFGGKSSNYTKTTKSKRA